MKAVSVCKPFFYAFLLFSLLVHLLACNVVTDAVRPTNHNLDTQDPYDWSSYPGEVIFDSPEFILDDYSGDD